MASVVTKLNKIKHVRCPIRKFHNTLRWLKRRAHRIDRRMARQVIKSGEDYYTIPRLTGRDL